MYTTIYTVLRDPSLEFRPHKAIITGHFNLCVSDQRKNLECLAITTTTEKSN